jgi:hypothetical protein
MEQRGEPIYARQHGYRKQRQEEDLEAQRAMDDALYGGYYDGIEGFNARGAR